MLFEVLHLDIHLPKTSKSRTKQLGNQSTSEAVLSQLADVHPLPKVVLEYRQVKHIHINCRITLHNASKWCNRYSCCKQERNLKIIMYICIVELIYSVFATPCCSSKFSSYKISFLLYDPCKLN